MGRHEVRVQVYAWLLATISRRSNQARANGHQGYHGNDGNISSPEVAMIDDTPRPERTTATLAHRPVPLKPLHHRGQQRVEPE